MMTIAAIIAAAFSFSACDNDRILDTNQSIVLSGQWYGDFGMYYTWIERGHSYTFDSYETDIVFYPAYDYATHGRGKQVDYYEYGPYEYQYYQFEWAIRDGYIYLYYDYDHELDTRISQYSMTNDYFSGVFPGGTRFRLRKIADYYNWTPFVNNWGYSYRDRWVDYYGGYYMDARTRSEAAPDSTLQEGKVVSRGRRTEIK